MPARRAKQPDIDALIALVEELNRVHGDATFVRASDYQNNWDRFEAFVYETEAGEVIAFVAGFETFHFDHAGVGFEIQNLHVSQQYRRQGIGKALLEFVMAEKSKDGVGRFAIGYQSWNEAAKGLYESLGFQKRQGPAVQRLYRYIPK